MLLHSERVTAPDADPEHWLLVLHGVFGSGSNWRLFMRQVARACPRWGFVLVDQRGHAGSWQDADPPHSVDAMADDLIALEGMLAMSGVPHVEGVVGHSLGGKVALAYAAKRAGQLSQVWILDSQPGARDESKSSPTGEVLAMLESLPETFVDRKTFTATVEGHGHSRMLAAWLATNVVRQDDRYVLRLDLPVVRAVLEDYYVRDLWSEIERSDSARQLHIVVAGQSFVWRDGDRARLSQLDGIQLHFLEGAGHWVHVDAPDALRAMMVSQLGTE